MVGEASAVADEVGEAVVLLGHCVDAGEVCLSCDGDVLLLFVCGGFADVNDVEWFELEDGVAYEAEVFVEGELEVFCGCRGVFCGVHVAHSTEDVYACERAGLCDAACQQYHVSDGGVLGVGILAGIVDFAVHLYGEVALHVELVGDEEYVAVVERDVYGGSVEYAFRIDAQYFAVLVFFFAMHDGALGVCAFDEAVGSEQQVFDALYLVAELVFSGMLYGSAHFYHVIVAHEVFVGFHEVAVCHLEGSHLRVFDGVDGVFVAHGSLQSDAFRVGFAVESACVFQEVFYCLAFLHFVPHGSFHVSDDFHEAVVWSYFDDVAVG